MKVRKWRRRFRRSAEENEENSLKIIWLPVTEAVITVPAYFNDAQRQATKDAGRIAAGKQNVSSTNRLPQRLYGLDKAVGNRTYRGLRPRCGGTFDISHYRNRRSWMAKNLEVLAPTVIHPPVVKTSIPA